MGPYYYKIILNNKHLSALEDNGVHHGSPLIHVERTASAMAQQSDLSMTVSARVVTHEV